MRTQWSSWQYRDNQHAPERSDRTRGWTTWDATPWWAEYGWSDGQSQGSCQQDQRSCANSYAEGCNGSGRDEWSWAKTQWKYCDDEQLNMRAKSTARSLPTGQESASSGWRPSICTIVEQKAVGLEALASRSWQPSLSSTAEPKDVGEDALASHAAVGSAPCDPANDSDGTGSGADRKHVRIRRPAGRLWCHIYVTHLRFGGFDLVPKLIGRQGANMKQIHKMSGCKLRVRGLGSGHLEVDGKREAPVPLMVAVTTTKEDADNFKTALRLVLQMLDELKEEYRRFCLPLPGAESGGDIFKFGDASPKARLLVQEIVGGEVFFAVDTGGAAAQTKAKLRSVPREQRKNPGQPLPAHVSYPSVAMGPMLPAGCASPFFLQPSFMTGYEVDGLQSFYHGCEIGTEPLASEYEQIVQPSCASRAPSPTSCAEEEEELRRLHRAEVDAYLDGADE